MSDPEEIDVLVIGAGQAGLSMAHQLARRKLRFVVLEEHSRVGDSWRERWDSLRLFTPAGHDSLPGLRFPAPPNTFPTKDEVADYLERYAQTFGLPVRTGVRVESLRRAAAGDRYEVAAGDARWLANQVVVATGAYHAARVPDFAGKLRTEIRQFHSSEYRNPAQLRPGGVLVVGAGNSGVEIALDVAPAHRTWLAGRHPGHLPVDIDGPAGPLFALLAFTLSSRLLTLSTPLGRRARQPFRSGAGPLVRAKPADLQAAGVLRIPARVVDARDGLPLLEDGQVIDVTNVIWSTGFNHSVSWIDVPIATENGWPVEQRGVVPSAPGLYFIGLPFLYSFNSSLVSGAGRDASYLADRIASRAAAALIK